MRPLRPSPRQHLAACLAALVLATSGCGSDDPTSPAPASATEKVTYLTGFGATGREGYAWVAVEKGFFREAGIDVDIQLGAAGDKNLASVAASEAQFAVIDYAGAVARAGNGQFRDFRLIGAINQQTLIAIMSLCCIERGQDRDRLGP